MDEFRLLVRNFLHSGNDAKSKNALFKQYEPLVRSRSNIMYQSVKRNCRVSRDDIYSEGCIGLLKCINNFNPFKSQRLSALAKFYIKSAHQDYSMDNLGVSGMRISNNSISRTAYIRLIKYAIETGETLPLSNESIDKLSMGKKDTMILTNINTGFFTADEIDGHKAKSDNNESESAGTITNDNMMVRCDFEGDCDVKKLKIMIDEVLMPHFDYKERIVFDDVVLNRQFKTRKSVYEELKISPSNLTTIERRVKRKFREVVKGYLDINIPDAVMP